MRTTRRLITGTEVQAEQVKLTRVLVLTVAQVVEGLVLGTLAAMEMRGAILLLKVMLVVRVRLTQTHQGPVAVGLVAQERTALAPRTEAMAGLPLQTLPLERTQHTPVVAVVGRMTTALLSQMEEQLVPSHGLGVVVL
jgi:hypothetical protein